MTTYVEGRGPAEQSASPGASRDAAEPAEAVDVERVRWTAADWIGLAVAVISSLFVFVQMRPDLLFADTTPSGGDMGAHVWAPAFLRDHLLPAGRLSGWTPDWYAGFPAFHFYMVIPSLAIVALNAGLPLAAAIPVAAIAVAAATYAAIRRQGVARWLIPAIVVALIVIPFPYGIAFKLVSVSGLIGFPLAAWSLGRFARSPEPVPAFLSVASLFFLFDTNFTIYGGNIASTLAGEFAFSMSLCLTLLALGLAIRGMDEGKGRVAAALVIGLVALTHVIPVFFAVCALGCLVVLARSIPRLWPVAVGIALVLIPVALADGTSMTVVVLAFTAAVVTVAVVVGIEPEVRSRFWWLAITGPVAALLSAFWLLPFYLREPYFNDMGWERLNEVGPAILTVPMKVALPVAAVGLALALAQRERVGVLFAMTGAVFVAAVANLGEGPLWNARLLPFFYLSVYLLAAVGAALVVRFVAISVSENFHRPDQRVLVVSAVGGLAVGLIAVAIPLRIMPFGQDQDDGTYEWLAFRSHAKSFIPSWTAWNYSGYERKPSYREYRDVVTAMGAVGEGRGCGRAMWEYSADLDRYGTPMALMLLPHWTDGCIGSMEGLYFESSATTPFHFLNQSVLSQSPSRAQRDLPYQGYDINRGIDQLQVMGVRYYMALTDESISAARENPELTEVAEAQPFVVFEVEGSSLVEPLAYEPIVAAGRTEEQAGAEASRFDVGWLSQAVTYYNDPGSYRALPAEDGPADWERAGQLLPVGGDQITPATVTDVRADTSSISFSVDQVGAPVLVKASYFPNWRADGADGPWRAGPNLMVVVPTDNEVTLSYGRTVVDWLGVLATVVGIVGLVGLGVGDHRPELLAGLLGRRSTRRPDEESAEEDQERDFLDELLGGSGDWSESDAAEPLWPDRDRDESDRELEDAPPFPVGVPAGSVGLDWAQDEGDGIHRNRFDAEEAESVTPQTVASTTSANGSAAVETVGNGTATSGTGATDTAVAAKAAPDGAVTGNGATDASSVDDDKGVTDEAGDDVDRSGGPPTEIGPPNASL